MARFNKQELELMRATFKDRDDLLKLLRKVFLPTIKRTDEIGVLTDMLLNVDMDTDMEKLAEMVKFQVKLVRYVEGQLLHIKSLANAEKAETAEDLAKRMKLDSTE